MNRWTYIKSLFLSFTLILMGYTGYGQNESILDFTVKELNGDTLELRQKLDPKSNYIIETMAFWCSPCIKSINKFNYHKNYWKDRFNVDVLLIEDEHWDDLPYVMNEMEEFGWDLDIVLTDKQYSSVGINSIPRYYFKGVASDSVERIYGNIEKFLLSRVDSIKFTPLLNANFKQALLEVDCDQLEVTKFKTAEDTIIKEVKYHLINNIPIRESNQNGNVIRYDEESGNERIHINYSAALCSRIWLRDMDGDEILVKILDRYQKDSVLHVLTDQVLSNECSDDTLPFEFIQNVGTNAGLFFDIEDGKIISRLICHEKENEINYTDNELGNLCLSLDVSNPTDIIEIRTYPNPVESTLFLTLNFEGEKKMEIYTSNGQKVMSKTTDLLQTQLKLPDDINSSLLMVRISTKYGVFTKKIIRLQD